MAALEPPRTSNKGGSGLRQQYTCNPDTIGCHGFKPSQDTFKPRRLELCQLINHIYPYSHWDVHTKAGGTWLNKWDV
jgi:hypothetical protein